MASIQASPYPLVFQVGNAPALGFAADASHDGLFRTQARALEGMQKEAVVATPGGTAWRMVSDEGPYLNGTDLAPFPLAFFTAGMAANYMSAVVAALKQQGVSYRDVRFTQNNRYSMTGSALKGTMTGGALPVEIGVQMDADAEAAALAQLVAAAIDASPVAELLRSKLDSEFSLSVNGRPTPTGRVMSLPQALASSGNGFDRVAPATNADVPTDIIQKLEAAEAVFGVAGGAGSSLSAEQDRTLHVCAACCLRADGFIEIRTQLLKPIGSVFRFLAANNTGADVDGARAPSGLAYLSAGIAFCYMTQLGRYAHIVKKPLADYRVVQDTRFSRPGTRGDVAPVRTSVFIDTPEDEAYGRTLVDMGEQTCFLHAACRSTVPIDIRIDS